MRTEEIVVLLTNKGYVAIANNEIFQLWKNKCLKDIYKELGNRYPNYQISLGSLEKVNFKDAVTVYNQFIKNDEQFETTHPLKKSNISKSNTNINKVLETGTNKMETRNKAKVKAVVVIGINITAGVMHLGFQTMADTVCYAEAKIIDQLNVFDKTVDEIMNARKLKTRETQQSLLKSPERVKQSASKFYCKIKDIKDQAKAEVNTIIQTA